MTPLQIFNRATDLFLPAVRPHTFAVLENLDRRGMPTPRCSPACSTATRRVVHKISLVVRQKPAISAVALLLRVSAAAVDVAPLRAVVAVHLRAW